MSRKDCFPGADGSTIQQTIGYNASTIPIYDTSGNTLIEGSATGLRMVNITTTGVLNGNTSQVYVIKHPLSFVYNQNEPWDWYTNIESYQNNALWEERKKSTYDPCPQGWRVPPTASKTFKDFLSFTASGSGIDVANGIKYSNIAWFSVAGYRRYSGGTLGNVGYHGYYWSTSSNETWSEGLYLSLNGVTPGYPSYGRGYAFPIRCIQE